MQLYKQLISPLSPTNPRQFYKRSQNFRLNAAVLTPAEFAERKASLVADLLSDKYYSEPAKTDPANPLTDPGMNDALFNMAKENLMSFVPQTLIVAWVNFFFADSVVMKLPFLLTAGFKGMLQTGINTPDLDVRYVSAISWYFVNLFGLRSVYSCLMSDPSKAQLLVQSQQQTPTFAGPGAPKADNLFPAAAESLQIVHHVSIFGDIASRVLRQYEHSG